MSTTIDQRVVEMRFDNQHFEKNVQTSISTLDKLKQSLNLTGASKGLGDINASAKNNNMGVLGSSVEQVHAKFSALQVMGVTALANITNSAVNAGKKMVSALTIDPIKTGLQEYETQINSVQTILANTSSKGTTIDDVNKALDELNAYADMTIYNFTEMTRNIGTFTAAGVDLDTSVSAIQGIANLAAVSGSTSQQASTAMYQLSQALSTGTVKLQDWNSVVNAGMGGQVFQDALVRTAAAMDGAAGNVEEWRAANVDSFGSFRDSLTQGAWLTTDVLTATLNQFTMAAEEGSAEWDAFKKSLKEQGYTDAQADEILKMANTATDAATKVKTFTQLWDVLKEAAQSGWTQTWEIIIGDFEEAKGLLTPLSDFFTGAINAISQARNTLLEGALGKSFSGLVDKINTVTKPIEKSADSIKSVVDSVKNYEKVVDDIIGGKWGNGQERWDNLAKAGYDWAHAQNMVNEKLGDSTRHATNYKEAQEEVNKAQEKSVEVTEASSAATTAMIARYCEMTDEQLRSRGFTDEQIKAFRELADVADKTGIPLKEFIDNIDQIDGRYLLINSFKNAGQGLVSVITALKDAWLDVFPPMSSDQLFNIIAGLHKFSTNLVMSEETADKLKRTFRGVLSIFGIISDVLGGGLKIALKAITALLGHFDLDILDVTAAMGDAIVAFRKATDLSGLFAKAIEFMAPIVSELAVAFKGWAKSFLELPAVEKAISRIKEVLENLKNVDLGAVGQNIVDGLVNGLNGGAEKTIQAIMEIGVKILEGIKEVLGIHSPSTEFFAIGGNIIDGLVNGLKNGISKVGEFFKTLGSKCMEFVSNIDWGSVYAGAVSVGVVVMLKKMLDILDAFSAPFGGLGDIFENAAIVLKKSTKNIVKILGGFAKVLKATAFEKTSKGIRNLAISIAILAASVYVLATFDDPKKLWNAVGVIAALAVVLGGLSVAISKMSGSAVSISKSGVKIGGMKMALVAIGASLLLLAATVKVLGSLDPEQAKQGFIRLAGCVTAIAVVLAAYGLLVKGKSAQNIGKLGGMMIKLSISLLLLAGVVKLIGMLSPEEIKQGAIFAAGFVVFVAALTGITRFAGKKIDIIGGMILKLSLAMMLLIGVVKLAGGLDENEIKKGLGFAIAFVAFVAALTAITRGKKGTEIQKVGGMLLAISLAMGIMAGVVKLIGSLSAKEMIKGGIAIFAFVAVIKTLITSLKTIKKDIPKVAGTLIAISIAIGILAGVTVMMSLMSIGGLAKGLVAVGLLGKMLTALIKSTKGAVDVKGSIIAMAVAIGVMAAAVAALSLIPFEKLAPAVAGLGILMGMFALIAKAASKMGKVMGSLIVMTVMIGVLAIVIWKLSQLPMNRALGAAGSLSILMLAMAASMAIIGFVGPIAGTALLAMGVLTLVVAALAKILIKMGEINPESAMGNVKALSALLLALSGACVILALAGSFGPAAFIGVAALATLIIGLGAVIVAIGALADKFPKLEEFLNKGLPILEKIGYGIGSFFGNIVGGFTDGATAGLPAMATNLSNFMTNLQPFVDGAKGVDETAFTSIKNIVKMLALIAGANVLEAISSFISGQSSMESFAKQISAFGDAIVEFSQKISGNINEEAVTAAANAGRMLAEMQTMVSGNGGIFQMFTGEKDLGAFGDQLIAFGDAIVSFSKAVSGNIDEEAVTAAANAGSLMAEMQSKIAATGGVVQWFTGEKDMETFAAQLTAFGEAISAFSQAVAGGISEEAVTAAANAGTLMAEMQSKIVPSGGVVQWFTGEKDMALFGEQIVAFGEAIVDFSHKVSEGVSEEAVTAAANAGAIMTELQSQITPTGGVIDFFTGSDSLDMFGTQIVAFGNAIVQFSKTVSGNIDEESITAAANAGTLMATLQKSIPEDKWLDGKVSIDSFGAKISSFGGYIKAYSEKVAGVDAASIDVSMDATKQIVNITKSLNKVDPDSVDNFKAKKLGSAIKDYSDKVSGISIGDINNSISAISRLKTLITGMAGMDTSGVSSFKSAVSSLASTNMDGVVDSFSSSASKLSGVGSNIAQSIANGMKSRQGLMNSTGAALVSNLQKQVSSKSSAFKDAGADAMAKFATGLKSGTSKIKSAIKAPILEGVTAARGYYKNFYNAGSYLVRGFAAGISANAWRAAAKAKAMANAAEKAAKEALDINSPSRVFAALGSGVVEGFVKGIRDNENDSEIASREMAETAVSGFSRAIHTVQNLLNGDMDVQPTICPVLDLSEVSAGAKSINGMFSMQPSIGVMSNLGAVSSLMNSGLQNGSNSDVISAIDRLRKSMNNLGNTTYNVNGITYDDGSNVSNAVKDIIRHTRIEGRV